MTVKIAAGSWAKNYNIRETLDLKDGANITDALAELAVPAGEIGLTVINGRAKPRDFELSDGDELEIFPVIVDG
jgi:sulfur carrier protein ThiS